MKKFICLLPDQTENQRELKHKLRGTNKQILFLYNSFRTKLYRINSKNLFDSTISILKTRRFQGNCKYHNSYQSAPGQTWREGLWPGSRDIPSQFWSSQSSLSLYLPPGNRVLHTSLQEDFTISVTLDIHKVVSSFLVIKVRNNERKSSLERLSTEWWPVDECRLSSILPPAPLEVWQVLCSVSDWM